MKVVSFLFYYSKLPVGVALGVHKTANPLGIKWRWNFWQHPLFSADRFHYRIYERL